MSDPVTGNADRTEAPARAAPLLRVVGITKSFGALVANKDISLSLNSGELHAVIGPNGAGKTTLLAQLAGELAPDSGRVIFGGCNITRLPLHQRAGLGIGRSHQITSLFPGFSAADNVSLALQAHRGHSFRFWRPAAKDEALAGAAIRLLLQVGLAGRADVPAGALSHGGQRRLELAMALAGKPRLLLLDEPMAGLGPDENWRMAELLAGLKGKHAILLIEHDMDAVFQLADQITVLVYGEVVASGPPDAIRADPEVRRAYLGEEV